MLSGMVGNVDSGEIIRIQETGETSKPIDLGIRAAKKLLSLGARELLNEK
jgi:hydroxymethylbilane synthase